MKTLIAVLAATLAATAVAGPAHAFDDGPASRGLVVTVQDRWERGGGFWDDGRGPPPPPPPRWDDRGPPPPWDEPRGPRWDRRDDALSERQVVRRLMRQGYVRIDDIERRRDRYIVRAVRPNGALIRLSVDAYDGDVIARERIGWTGGGRRGFDRPTNGIEFDLGGGRLGIYSR